MGRMAHEILPRPSRTFESNAVHDRRDALSVLTPGDSRSGRLGWGAGLRSCRREGLKSKRVAILHGEPAMTLDAVTDAVRRLEQRLRTEFGVAALYVFGSVARGEARHDSDIDVLVEFDGPATFARFMDLKALLEDTLGTQVDLVTRAALRSQLKPRIEAEARRVA